MRENKSPLTISQSMKIYTGTGLAGTVTGFVLYETVFYAGICVFMTLLVSVADGKSFPDAAVSISETPAFDVLMALAPALLNCLIMLAPHDRFAAGGKLFRTIKGGFGTFVKSRIGIYLSAVLATLIFCAIVLIFDLLGILKVRNSIFSEAGVFAAAVAALGAGTFALMTSNDNMRGFLSFFVCLMVTAGVTVNLNFSAAAGRDPIPYAVVTVIGFALIVLSVKLYLMHYKKKHWDN